MSYPTFATVLGNELLEQIEDEVSRARKKFPGTKHLNVALMEEVGELAQAQLQRRGDAAIRKEAIQVIAVAVRIIQEGDADLANISDASAKP